VTVVFEEACRSLFRAPAGCRTADQAKESLPEGVEPQMGPVTTGLGEVLMYVVDIAPAGTKEQSQDRGQTRLPTRWQLPDHRWQLADRRGFEAGYLRTVQDWVIRPQLKTVEGVAGIDSIGGYEKQFVVEPDVGQTRQLSHLLFRARRAHWKRPISRSAQTLSNAAARRFWSGRWPHPHTG
jgi:cobalt-zinc-cadmium resistance protein CzcA